MQRWEYKTILRSRSWGKDKDNPKSDWWVAADWNMNIVEAIEELGNDGWELVAIEPRSDYLGSSHYGNISEDFAGYTSTDLWVFKRPKA